MMKVVLKVEICDAKTKRKVMGTVSGLLGIVSVAADTKENKITVIGTADPIKIVKKVRKVWPSAYLISVGPEKEEAKKPDPKKEEAQPKIDQIDWVKACNAFHSYPTTHYYYPYQEQYNPNTCVIS
ncbi:heavy metal-associated isoprenylated plant protein 39-like [Benincasa hispida]|uniref:heavy metal-associated isoprenylated plant protein 39-like n=1 Tax=Benincasa hispida TaxID=102211 RepID=UPI0019018895|nr:heavy metal-associated isoprenylated plant protein 39-like [Benincasa hispida]